MYSMFEKLGKCDRRKQICMPLKCDSLDSDEGQMNKKRFH